MNEGKGKSLEENNSMSAYFKCPYINYPVRTRACGSGVSAVCCEVQQARPLLGSGQMQAAPFLDSGEPPEAGRLASSLLISLELSS